MESSVRAKDPGAVDGGFFSRRVRVVCSAEAEAGAAVEDLGAAERSALAVVRRRVLDSIVGLGFWKPWLKILLKDAMCCFLGKEGPVGASRALVREA